MERWGVLSRTVAAVGGGYALAALLAMECAVALPMARLDAVLVGMMLGLLAFAGVVIWVFAARSAARAWAGLLLPGMPLYAALLVQGAAWPR